MCHPFPGKRLREQATPVDVNEEASKRSRNTGAVAIHPTHRAVVFDLDETTGNWGLGSLAYQIFVRYGGDPTALILPFVDCYLERGGARPWLRELLRCLEKWKEAGRIDEIAIFTAASNELGWVGFLRDCMEIYAGVPGLFGRVASRENSPLVTAEDGTRTIKDLSRFSPDAGHVVLIDDKPQFALNGYVIGVPQYSQDVCCDDLREWMKTQLPVHASDIDAIFAADLAKHPPNLVDFTSDSALRDSAKVLNMVFPETPALAAEAAFAVNQLLMASA